MPLESQREIGGDAEIIKSEHRKYIFITRFLRFLVFRAFCLLKISLRDLRIWSNSHIATTEATAALQREIGNWTAIFTARCSTLGKVSALHCCMHCHQQRLTSPASETGETKRNRAKLHTYSYSGGCAGANERKHRLKKQGYPKLQQTSLNGIYFINSSPQQVVYSNMLCRINLTKQNLHEKIRKAWLFLQRINITSNENLLCDSLFRKNMNKKKIFNFAISCERQRENKPDCKSINSVFH